jgi:cysteine desulfurase
MGHIYLDYAASTPVDPRVLRAMEPYFSEKFGNPGSLHSFGQEAIAAVDKSREEIARAIGVPPSAGWRSGFREVIFVGSATEANNLALRGVVRSAKIKNPRIIVSSIEHESILETVRDLEKDGAEVVYLPVDRRGTVDLKKLEAALNERTVLVSVMYANNEIGTVQPLSAVAEVISNWKSEIRKFRNQLPITNYQLPLFHTDAAQAFQFLDCDVNKLGIDLMTLSSHKIYGPKGIGALYVRQETRDKRQGANESLSHVACRLLPIISGGGQEFGLRSGTENTPAIVGFAKAVELVTSDKRQATNRIAGLRDNFWRELKEICPKAEVNGPTDNSERLANVLNVYFPGHKSEDLMAKFDLSGVAVSAGSACRSRAVEGSYVIEALGHSNGSTKLTTGERAKSSIRFSFGRPTTGEETERALTIIKRCL